MTLKNIKMYPEAPIVTYEVSPVEVRVLLDNEDRTVLKVYRDEAAKDFCKKFRLGLYSNLKTALED